MFICISSSTHCWESGRSGKMVGGGEMEKAVFHCLATTIHMSLQNYGQKNGLTNRRKAKGQRDRFN